MARCEPSRGDSHASGRYKLRLRRLLLGRHAVKMERVSQVLQFPVIVEGRWPFSRESQLLEKLDFLVGRIAPQRGIPEEGLEPWFFADRWAGFPFDELEFLRVSGRQAAVQHYLHPERREIDVPRFDQRTEKRDAVFDREVEDIRLQELEHDDSRLLVTSVGESRHETEPVFIVQFLFRHSLDDVQQLLSDEAFQGAEGLLLEHLADGLF